MSLKLASSVTDPIYSLIAAHRDAHRNFCTALDIPETPERIVEREKEEERTSELMHKAEIRLAHCNPTTLLGAVAALQYFVSEGDLLIGADDSQVHFLQNLSRSVSRLLGVETNGARPSKACTGAVGSRA
jgi:hypothetical protein